MSSAGTPRSFDAPRPRRIPAFVEGVDDAGLVLTRTITSPTLIVVVKDNCGGCSEFVANQAIIPVTVLLVTESADASQKYGAFLAPAFIAAIDARFAPVYVLVAGEPLGVATEGTVFSAEQVLTEISPFL